MSDRLRMAVIGVGYLGRFHAQKLARMEDVDLLRVVDLDQECAERVGREVDCRPFGDWEGIIDQVDAVSVVTPTATHYEVARGFLAAGKDVLCEKPITTTVEEADGLIALAEEKGCILQVGHLERFNPAVQEMLARAKDPMFIECNRIAPFKPRAAGVDVALDLMIHDLDLIMLMLGQDPSAISAVGVPVVSPQPDIVNARLEFPSGCVANVTASRLALKDERKMRLFQPDAYLNLDFKKRALNVVAQITFVEGKRPKVKAQKLRFSKNADPLNDELKSFVASVRSRQTPAVTGVEGRRALAAVLAVRAEVDSRLPGLKDKLEASGRWVEASGPEAD